MKKSGILNLIYNLTGEEVEEIRLFLKSPVFVRKQVLCNFFEMIVEERYRFIEFSYNEVIEYLARNFNYSPGTVKKQLTYLNIELKKFLKVKENLSDEINAENNINKYFLKRGLHSLLHSNLVHTDTKIFNRREIDEKLFLNSYNHSINQFNYLTNVLSTINPKNTEKKIETLNNSLEDIILYTIIQLTSAYINYSFLNVNIGQTGKINFPIDLDGIYKFVAKSGLFKKGSRNTDTYNLYNSMYYAFLVFNDKNHYLKYKSEVFNLTGHLSKELARFHYDVLINYCIMKQRTGEEYEFYINEEVKLLYQYTANNYFKENAYEYLAPETFRNFIVTAFYVGNYDLLKAFIDENSTKLKPSDYVNFVNYGLAYFYLGIGDYRKALKCVAKIGLSKFVFKFDIINIQIRLYFELGHYEVVSDIAHNYRAQVIKDKILTKADKEQLFVMLRFLNKLLQIQNSVDFEKQYNLAFYLRKSMEKVPVFGLRKWLFEKTDAVIEQYKSRKASSY
jgi:hypothetical protein